VEHRKQERGDGGRFVGPRVNCELVPCLPAGALAWVLDDPRQVPYLMVWKDDRSGEIVVIARVARYTAMDSGVQGARWVQISRPNGRRNWILTIERAMPRERGKARFVICPRCQQPRRALYPWRLNPAELCAVAGSATWLCRSCSQLRYASEGGALLFHPRTALGRLIEKLEGPSQHPRPDPWYPHVFSDPRDAEAIVHRTITFITLPSGFKIPSDDTDEVAVFPTGKRDDAVDDTAQALNCLRQGSIVPPKPFLMPGDLHSTELDQEELWEKAMQGFPMTSEEIDRM
jgi:hypothetical protein